MTVSRRILILFTHPALWKSRFNPRLLAGTQRVAGVTVRYVYEDYLDFMINAQRGQDLLEAHGVILYQHPVYLNWCPGILKGWVDPMPLMDETSDTQSLSREVRRERP